MDEENSDYEDRIKVIGMLEKVLVVIYTERGEDFVTRKISIAVAKICADLQEKLSLGNLDATKLAVSSQLLAVSDTSANLTANSGKLVK